MDLDKKKHIDLYQWVFDNCGVKNIHKIDLRLFSDYLLCEVFFIDVVNETNNFKSFEHNRVDSKVIRYKKSDLRNINTDILFNEGYDEPYIISSNDNIKYLRYQNGLKKFIDNRRENFYKYLKEQGKGTPVYVNFNEKGVVDRVVSKDEIYVYSHTTKEVNPYRLFRVELRDRKSKPKIEELDQDLNKLKTIELIRLKNQCYGNWEVIHNGKAYDIKDIKDILSHREHIERKPNKKYMDPFWFID